MESETVFSILSVVGTAFSVFLYLSPFKIIKEMQEKGDTSGHSFAPYFMMIFSTILGVLYGVIADIRTFTLVNGFGFIMSSYYVFKFYSSSRESSKQSIQTTIVFGTSVLLIIFYFILRISTEPRSHLGIINNISGIIMFASPLATMSTVIATKNAASIPLPLSSASLGMSICWFLFGFLLSDYFVMIPNVIGITLSSFQILLVWTYGQRIDRSAEDVTKV